MDDRQAGSLLRTLRVEKRFRQRDIARKARVPRGVVMRIEAGRFDRVTVGQLRAVAEANGAWLENRIRTPGDDGLRLLHRGHASAQLSVVELLQRLGWAVVPEASFAIFGERGVIDVLAWHPGHRAILIVEVKTLLVDASELLATMDRRIRLSPTIAAERGWSPSVVGAWIAVTDTRLNRQRLAGHAQLLRSAFPDDGRQVRRWLREPHRALRALGFMRKVAVGDLTQASGRPRRVRVGRGERVTHGSAVADGQRSRPAAREPRVGVTFRE